LLRHNQEAADVHYIKRVADWSSSCLSLAAETYKAGQPVPVHQAITANHEGRMIIRLCPLNATAQNYEEVCQILPR
jgi:hypothetical protein